MIVGELKAAWAYLISPIASIAVLNAHQYMEVKRNFASFNGLVLQLAFLRFQSKTRNDFNNNAGKHVKHLEAHLHVETMI